MTHDVAIRFVLRATRPVIPERRFEKTVSLDQQEIRVFEVEGHGASKAAAIEDAAARIATIFPSDKGWRIREAKREEVIRRQK